MKYLLMALLGAAWSQRNRLFDSSPASGSFFEIDARIKQIKDTTSWQFLEDMYLYHKAVRHFHATPGLRFNRTLTDTARFRALLLAYYGGQIAKEEDDIRFGENTAWISAFADHRHVSASHVLEKWYIPEEKEWNYNDPHISDKTKRFSQMVWSSTVAFGCGQAVSEGIYAGTYTVCCYDPSALKGQERGNVRRPKYPSGSDEARCLFDNIIKYT